MHCLVLLREADVGTRVVYTTAHALYSVLYYFARPELRYAQKSVESVDLRVVVS